MRERPGRRRDQEMGVNAIATVGMEKNSVNKNMSFHRRTILLWPRWEESESCIAMCAWNPMSYRARGRKVNHQRIIGLVENGIYMYCTRDQGKNMDHKLLTGFTKAPSLNPSKRAR